MEYQNGQPLLGRAPAGALGHHLKRISRRQVTVPEELVAQDPDITLYELRDTLAAAEGVEVHHSSIASLLSRLGFTYKKSRWWPPSAIVLR